MCLHKEEIVVIDPEPDTGVVGLHKGLVSCPEPFAEDGEEPPATLKHLRMNSYLNLVVTEELCFWDVTRQFAGHWKTDSEVPLGCIFNKPVNLGLQFS